jgi:putative phosphoesterase
MHWYTAGIGNCPQHLPTWCKRPRRVLPLYGVLGNRDDKSLMEPTLAARKHMIIFPDNRELLEISFDDQRFVVYHGHHKSTLRRLLARTDYDVLCTGHTHKPRIDTMEGKIVINPGSTAFSIPRRHEPRTVAVYDTVARSAVLIPFEP